MAPPRPAALCPDPRPLLGASPGVPRPALARAHRGARKPAGASERASERGGGRGWEEQPANLGAGRASAGEAARRRAGERSFLRLRSRSRPRAAATHSLPNCGAESRGPESLSQRCAPLIARDAASGAPDCALYKYLPSAHGVPSAGRDAAGMRREESEPALPSGDAESGQGGGLSGTATLTPVRLPALSASLRS
ncbi:translation initiation factor IF-2-like [Prionailurus viverrinus]|uniref:translation initiation factor IF-2-like n=1 Tax=Prionailurus viverrinus TaxID=61388 RepID=UPI001FF22336|nr:translation initiation factor IF-2-like [Prionailurus viverrinus]